MRARVDRPLRSGTDRCRSRLPVSAAGVGRWCQRPKSQPAHNGQLLPGELSRQHRHRPADGVQDSDFYDNHESGSSGGYVDGVGFKAGSGAGNRIRGCRVYDNSGDGLDLSGFDGSVTIDHTWAFGNGVNRWGLTKFSAGGSGSRLGGHAGLKVAPVVSHSAAWDNAGFGFTETGSAGTPRLTNDTAYRNGAAGFAFVTSAAVLQRDLALGGHPDVRLGTQAGHTANSCDQQGWTTAALHLTGIPSPTAAQPEPLGQ
ncbi:right-handed parallel beta-helix repeat-containing protein [Streptomyces sp. NPDC094038]|uniref:right-handed parallel beta-helix repeat-containing protein n=1 Tax=Streptomyces sp. NPDC094038 TaxID=3366055 RepID=UPI00382D56BC